MNKKHIYCKLAYKYRNCSDLFFQLSNVYHIYLNIEEEEDGDGLAKSTFKL